MPHDNPYYGQVMFERWMEEQVHKRKYSRCDACVRLIQDVLNVVFAQIPIAAGAYACVWLIQDVLNVAFAQISIAAGAYACVWLIQHVLNVAFAAGAHICEYFSLAC